MFTRVGLERILVSAAIFLSLFPSWRHSSVFFTISDLRFCLSLLTILLTRGLPLAPFGALTPHWMAGFALLIASLVASSLINGEAMRAIVVSAQYAFSFVLLPLTIMGREREATIGLIQAFALGVFAANLASVVLYYSGYTGDLRFVTAGGRLGSFVGNANTNAQMIALALPLMLYLWLAGRIAVLYLVPALLCMLVALILTSSNNGLLLAISGVAALFIMLRDLRYLVRAATGLAVCLALILLWASYWLPETFEERVLSAVRSGSIEEAGTFEDRMALIEEAMEMIDETMLVGLGALVGWMSLLLIALFGALFIGRRHRLEAATAFAVAAIVGLIGLTTGHIYARYDVVPLHLALALVFASAAEASSRHAPAWQGEVELDGPADRKPARS